MLAGLAFAAMAAAPPVPALRPHLILKGHISGVGWVAFSPDGKLLASACRGYARAAGRYNGEFKIHDLAGELRYAWSGGKDGPAAIAFVPNRKQLLSITSSLELTLWDVESGYAERTWQADRACSPARWLISSADGKQIGACSPSCALILDGASGKELHRHNLNINGWGAVLSHDLRLLAAPNHQDVDLWDVRSGKLVRSLLDHRGMVEALAFSRDDRLLAATCSGPTDDNETVSEVWLWDVKRGARKRVIPLGNLFARWVALSPQGDLLAVTGSLDVYGAGELRLFETASGRELARVQPPRVKWLASPVFRPDGKLLAVGCDDGTVRVWSVTRNAGKNKR
jgi:WD40 repeat protein